MKLVSFREHKQTDMYDCRAVIKYFKSQGYNVDTDFICQVVNKYFDINDLSDDAKKFIGLR